MLTKEIMLTKTINNNNNKKNTHTFSDESKHARINNQERERREQTSIKYKYYQCCFFFPRQTLYDLTELLVGSKSQKVRQ